MSEPNQKPTAVVFDLGKVLLHFDYSIALRKIQAHCRLSLEELHRLVDQSPLLLRFESDQLTPEAFFREVQQASGFAGEFALFKELFCDIFTPIDPMVRLHAAIRDRGIPTYIFSNTNHLQIGYVAAQFPFFKNFDGHILSCEHGTMKPDPKLYEVVERMTGRRGAELLYIDDRPENVATGLERGWRAILHEAPEATERAVRESGILG
jgi:HAD superfamily hydrolase (TIGR01509 family)